MPKHKSGDATWLAPYFWQRTLHAQLRVGHSRVGGFVALTHNNCGFECGHNGDDCVPQSVVGVTDGLKGTCEMIRHISRTAKDHTAAKSLTICADLMA
jgi:hypothetical protein